MIRAQTESSADVIRWIENEAAGLWPAMLGSPRCRQRACLAGPAGASRAALRPGVEARTGERSEAQEELSRGAGGGAADQLCGCRADAAGRAPGAAAGGDFEVP